jgi:hypothetical protein
LGNGTVYRRSRNSAGESCTGNEYLDQVPRHRYSWKYDNLDGIRRRVRNSGAKAWIFDGISGSRTQVIPKSDLLASSTRHPNPLSVERFRMEIVRLSDESLGSFANRFFQLETNVLPSNISPHSRDSEVQHSRLQTTVRHASSLFSFVVTTNDQSRMEQFQKAIRKVRQVQRMRKQRGYAFSQADESQTRVLQAYDTTRERGRYGEMASSRPKGR